MDITQVLKLIIKVCFILFLFFMSIKEIGIKGFITTVISGSILSSVVIILSN